MTTKRLYIGGLGHSISPKDLKDRFGKFGQVSDVEVVTRKDEDGNPVKTFGYISIDISEAEFRRCVTVLNKSKWKGGTIQIETAKESFLHRLAEERQQAAENAQPKNLNHKEGLVDSLKKAGVENYHMKAAVPGTEIPGHTDWVVSKFGRVLPVLNLKCKSKIFKYDPSKHCHNIKKLDTMTDDAEVTPVSQLTWEIPGGDDDISKKRRGEFPPQKKKTKKIKQDLMSLEKRSTLDGDDETLDEARSLITKEVPKKPQRAEDYLEVVGDDFLVKSSVFQHGESINLPTPGHLDDDRDYDSADTDEILTRSKTLNAPETELKEYSKPGLLCEMQSDECENTSTETTHLTKKPTAPSEENGEESDSSEESESSEESDSSVDSDYEAMMTNCCRLEISFGDLEMLAKQSLETSGDEDENSHEAASKPVSAQKRCINPEEILASILESSEDEGKKPKRKKRKEKSVSSLPAFMGTKGLFENSDASEPEPDPCMKIQNHEEPSHSVPNSECNNPPEAINDSLTLTHASSTEQSGSGEEQEREVDAPAAHSTLESSASAENTKDETNMAMETSDEEKDAIPETLKNSPSSRSQETTETLSNGVSSNKEDKQAKYATTPEVTSSKEQDEESRAFRKAPVCDAEKQRQDNEKRLAALEQRQRETEQLKKLIQGSLAEVDTPNANKGKHLVFDSDDEGDDDDDDEADDGLEDTKPKPSGASRLFDSSEGEDDDASDEERFQLKPQFEGKAGQKLMALQSRFGADERFQMDARFMESEMEEEPNKSGETSQVIEEELVEEKNKNLEILQSVLNINKPASGAEPTKSKIFRDISALHYDPTRKDHAAFEKRTEPKTEGKAARRKKQAEAEKLPEVSKDIFYDVAVDLKEVFGSTTTTVEGKKDVFEWDKEEEEVHAEEMKEQSPRADGHTDVQSDVFSSATPEKTESSGFKFSFFGEEEEIVTDTNAMTGEYKTELLRGPKASWQGDPRFQDSSSEEEDTEETEGDNKTASVIVVEDLKPSKKMLFFFYQDDARLKEGPRMFCRPAKLGDQREEWEGKRTSLIEEYRKKHKVARKKLRESHRN
ncbi:nucleolar protein 8 [Clupea harengus]|uniref:Nucleolar protein 8 n=1 Tax=Clupea harengus TaxID=7950 RepID=A0A6P3VLE6_CLUHA|nr:nucleolar protein 8 [Clupea harengus]XP_031424346.1 nucleolar protein 8 [Clupea harengus]